MNTISGINIHSFITESAGFDCSTVALRTAILYRFDPARIRAVTLSSNFTAQIF